MNLGRFFKASDYDLVFNLQNHFHEYVDIYTRLHYPDSANPLPNKERNELTVKLEETVGKINLLAMKMKQFQPDLQEADYQTSGKPMLAPSHRP